jgi:hypothetical protein
MIGFICADRISISAIARFDSFAMYCELFSADLSAGYSISFGITEFPVAVSPDPQLVFQDFVSEDANYGSLMLQQRTSLA